MSIKVIFVTLAIVSIAHGSVFMSCKFSNDLFLLVFFLFISSICQFISSIQFILGEGQKEPISIDIDNCNDEHCSVKRNEVSKMVITFKTDSEATDLRAKVRAQVAGMWLPWPLGKLSKVCEHLTNVKCPLPANTEAKYTFAVTIPSIAPVGTKVVVEYKILDQKKNNVACTRIPVYIAA